MINSNKHTINFYQMLRLLENSSQYLNLLNNKNDVFAAFELMEGKHTLEWHESRYGSGDSRYNIYGAIDWLNADPETKTTPTGGTSFHVYGDGGVHRYFVRPNGDIEFSALHVSFWDKKAVIKARDLGFKIHPYNWESLPRFN